MAVLSLWVDLLVVTRMPIGFRVFGLVLMLPSLFVIGQWTGVVRGNGRGG